MMRPALSPGPALGAKSMLLFPSRDPVGIPKSGSLAGMTRIVLFEMGAGGVDVGQPAIRFARREGSFGREALRDRSWFSQARLGKEVGTTARLIILSGESREVWLMLSRCFAREAGSQLYKNRFAGARLIAVHRRGGPMSSTACSVTRSSSVSSTSAAARFSSRWPTEVVPGISRMRS
jgi:hypothetical protein